MVISALIKRWTLWCTTGTRCSSSIAMADLSLETTIPSVYLFPLTNQCRLLRIKVIIFTSVVTATSWPTTKALWRKRTSNMLPMSLFPVVLLAASLPTSMLTGGPRDCRALKLEGFLTADSSSTSIPRSLKALIMPVTWDGSLSRWMRLRELIKDVSEPILEMRFIFRSLGSDILGEMFLRWAYFSSHSNSFFPFAIDLRCLASEIRFGIWSSRPHQSIWAWSGWKIQKERLVFSVDVKSNIVLVLDPHERNGVFLDACFHHCGSWNEIFINKYDTSIAFEQWYNSGDGVFIQNDRYPCMACCHPPKIEYWIDRTLGRQCLVTVRSVC